MPSSAAALVAAGLSLLGLACTPAPSEPASPTENGQFPWSVEQRADGSTAVFGLSPGQSTLSEARARFAGSSPPDVALFEDAAGALSLEAYFSEVSVSRLTGKLILRLSAPAPLLADIQRRSEREPLGTGTFRYAVPPGEDAALDALVMSGITFAPTARLDEAALVTRFGAPEERAEVEGGAVVLLYPARGVGVVLNPKGREQIQYVAPAAFGALRARLLAASGEGGGGAGVHQP